MSFGKRMARRKGERKSIGIARENSCKEKRALFQASPNKYCAPDFIFTSRPAVPGFILFGATCSAEERNCPRGDLPPQGSADWPPSDGGLSTEIEDRFLRQNDGRCGCPVVRECSGLGALDRLGRTSAEEVLVPLSNHARVSARATLSGIKISDGRLSPFGRSFPPVVAGPPL